MPYNAKSLANLDKGHKWVVGESGNPAGRPINLHSQRSLYKRFRCLKIAVKVAHTETDVRAIGEGMYTLAMTGHIPASKWLLDVAFGKVHF
jgi:hypothetical protein